MIKLKQRAFFWKGGEKSSESSSPGFKEMSSEIDRAWWTAGGDKEGKQTEKFSKTTFLTGSAAHEAHGIEKQ